AAGDAGGDVRRGRWPDRRGHQRLRPHPRARLGRLRRLEGRAGRVAACRATAGRAPGRAERGRGAAAGGGRAGRPGLRPRPAGRPAPGWAACGASTAGLDAWLRAVRPQAARQGVRIAIVELPLVATAMAVPTYGSAPRGALSPAQAAQRVLHALDAPRTLVSPGWARAGATLAQAAPALSAAAAGRAGQ